MILGLKKELNAQKGFEKDVVKDFENNKIELHIHQTCNFLIKT